MQILIIEGKSITEVSSYREVLDWAILRMKEQTVEKAQTTTPKGETKPTKGEEALAKITETEVKGAPNGQANAEVKAPNSYDLPPMRKPFFGGKDKGEMLSFDYSINEQTPRARPADTCRILFTKTTAFAELPPKEKDKVVNWGLSFLKKKVRETGKAASITTNMVEAYAYDRFSFLKGATVTFKVSIKK